jgi:hypothetical protein
MTRAVKRIVGVVSVLSGIGCGGNVAPRSPTWEADVYPILQGQCLHCHGSTWEKNGGGRYDFFDLSKCSDVEFTVADGGVPTFSVSPQSILAFVEPQDSGRPYMPPAPASLLEDWELETLRNWSKQSDKEKRRGVRGGGNRKPKIVVTSEYPEKVGDELKVSYRFEDSDGDPVIGVLKFGEAKVNLLKFSDEVTLSGFNAQSGDTLKLSAQICDGWDSVSLDIKEIEKE